MSNLDSTWPEAHAKASANEGWILAWTINSGDQVNRAYMEMFQLGPRFKTRAALVKHVIDAARAGSKLHATAMGVVLATRREATTP